MKVFRLLLFFICSFALLSPVMACLTQDAYIDGIRIDYPNLFLSLDVDYDLPGVPGSKDKDYADAIICWGDDFDIPQISEEVAIRLLDIPVDGGFDDATNISEEAKNFRDEYYKEDQPILVRHLMRDILFLQTMQHSIRHWEKNYIITPITKQGNFSYEEAYERAEKILNMYKEYQANRGIQNLLLSVLFGAGENDYGAKTTGAVPDFLTDDAHGILKNVAKAKFDRLGLLGSTNVNILRVARRWRALLSMSSKITIKERPMPIRRSFCL